LEIFAGRISAIIPNFRHPVVMHKFRLVCQPRGQPRARDSDFVISVISKCSGFYSDYCDK